MLLSIAPISFIGAESQENLVLQVSYDDIPEIGNPKPKAPVRKPTIIKEGYNITFVSPCNGCTLRIVNEDGDVEYFTIVSDATKTLALPSYLSGEYRIEIIRGRFCFFGNITL